MRLLILAILFCFSIPAIAFEIELVVQRGHSAPVKNCFFSADGNYLASTDHAGNVIVWYMQTGNELIRFYSENELAGTFFSPKNEFIYTCDVKGNIKKWSIFNSELIKTISTGFSIDQIIRINESQLFIRGDKGGVFSLSDDDIQVVYSEKVFAATVLSDDQVLMVGPEGKLIVWKNYTIGNGNLNEISNKAVKNLEKRALNGIYYSEKHNALIYHQFATITSTDLGKEKVNFRINNDYPEIPIQNLAISSKNDLLVIGTQDAKVIVYSLGNGKKIKRLTDHLASVNSVTFSPDESIFVTASSDYSLIIWDAKSLKPIKRLYARTFPINNLDVDKNGDRFLVANRAGFVKLIDFSNQRIELTNYQNHFAAANVVRFHPSGKFFVSGGADHYLAYMDLEHPSNSRKIEIFKKDEDKVLPYDKVREPLVQDMGWSQILSIDFSYDGKKMIVTGKDAWVSGAYQKESVYIYNTDPLTLEASAKVHLHDVASVRFRPGSYDFITSNDIKVSSWHYNEGQIQPDKEFWKIDFDTSNNYFQSEHFRLTYYYGYRWRLQMFNPSELIWIDQNNFVFNNDSSLIFADVNTGKQDSLQVGHRIQAMRLVDKGILAFSDKDKIRFIDIMEKTFLKEELIGHSDTITGIANISGKDMISSTSLDGTIKLWNKSKFELICTIVPIDGTKLIAFTPDGYYYSTKNAISALGFKKGNQFFPADQFDLKYNRPDIVLDRVGYTDQNLIQAYHWAYKKRIKKMGFTEEMLHTELELPELNILNMDGINLITPQEEITLKIRANDAKHNLDRLNIWINGVSIFGANGLSLRKYDSSEFSDALTVRLAHGINNIQISVLNEAGVESYKETVRIESTGGKDIPDLFIATIGVSNYKDGRYNLTYASKDAYDMVKTFAEARFYNEVHTKTLTDNSVTLQNLSEIADFFESAERDDHVILFVAGHGVLDENFDYYYASYDMDFQNPGKYGIPYDALESLIDKIKPLKKLLFMDTCHSGEVDKDEIVESKENNENGEEDIVFRSVGVAVENKNSLGLQNTSNLMKDLFTDLRKGTGATVISSAGGVELAIESDTWKNGLFTYCLIDGLTNRKADLNKDKQITISELQTFIQTEVSRLSKGRQTPTSRIQNNELNYRIW